MTNELFIRLQRDTTGFQPLAGLLYQWTGIRLPSGPTGWSLMASRLCPVLPHTGASNYSQYFAKIKSLPPRHPDREAFISAMSTHTTSFFRESVHFDTLRDSFRKSKEVFKVWSAACSSGAEAYSMAMVLEDARVVFGGNYKILATDIAEDVLVKARSGIISSQEAEGIPARLRNRFWKQQPPRPGSTSPTWSAAESLRNSILWAKLNLIEDAYPRTGTFDVIFCRNVLIYFTQETASSIIEKLMLCLKPGGLLILGHADAGMMQAPDAERLGSAVFSKQTDARSYG